MLQNPLHWVLLLILCYSNARAESASIEESQSFLAHHGCQTLVCKNAHEQAKGLSRLALLDEFVAQTILLLNDLMKNVDQELSKTTNVLMNSLPQNCYSTREILDEILNKQKDKLVQRRQVIDKNLGNGVKELNGHHSKGENFEGRHNVNSGLESDYEGSNIYEGPQIYANDRSSENYDEIQESNQNTGAWSYDQRNDQSSGQEADAYENSWPNNNIKSWNNRHRKGSQSSQWGSTSIGASGTSGNAFGESLSQSNNGENSKKKTATNYYSPSNKTSVKNTQTASHNWQGNKGFEDHRDQHGDNDQYRGGNYKNTKHLTEESDDHSRHSLGSQKYGFKNVENEPQITSESKSQSINFDTRETCQGVGTESAFWVPGLDQWCTQNCANGYCPKTHCVCN